MIRWVVGLGNPGRAYAGTRHNMGFRVLDELARRAATRWHKGLFRNYWWCEINDPRPAFCCKPATYMNRSGEAVRAVMAKRGYGPDDVLVVCDDVSLPLGALRLRPGGSAGGHNGLKSIIAATGTDRFARLRLGVGQPEGGLVAYVLSAFRPDEQPLAEKLVAAGADAVRLALSETWETAVRNINRRIQL